MKILSKSKFPLITLTTDFGTKDNYTSVMKGIILNINSYAKIIDITHEIPPQDISTAAFFLNNSFRYFPKNTIHICVVDPDVGSKRNILAVKFEGHIFIIPDNGLISLILQKKNPEKIIAITNKKYFLKNISNTFHGRDIFAPVAAYLSKGLLIDKLGHEIKTWIKKEPLSPKILKNSKIEGKVIWIDHFGNIITNINKKHINEKSVFKIKKFLINGLSTNYCSKKDNEPLAIIGSFDRLEISLNKNNAAKKLNIKIGDSIFVTP